MACLHVGHVCMHACNRWEHCVHPLNLHQSPVLHAAAWMDVCLRVRACAQVLLVVPASALQGALAGAAEELGGSTSQLQHLLLSDPGALLGMGFMGGPSGAADSWAARLSMDPEAVTALVSAVPALVELSPNTLRWARRILHHPLTSTRLS